MARMTITYRSTKDGQKITHTEDKKDPLSCLVQLIETENPYEATLHAYGIKLGEYASKRKNTVEMINQHPDEAQYYDGFLIMHKPATLKLNLLHRKFLTGKTTLSPLLLERLNELDIKLPEDVAPNRSCTPTETTPEILGLIAIALYDHLENKEKSTQHYNTQSTY